MANRVLRDWTKSEKIDTISPEGEVFFTRLIMKVDDYGYYYANLKLLKSEMYPLKDHLSVADINKWLKECVSAELITTYKHDGKDYLFIPEFGQRLRIMRSKFPPMPEGSKVLTNDSDTSSEGKGNETKLNTKVNSIDQFFKDLPNSTDLEDVARAISVDKNTLIKKIPDFRKKARLSYPNMQELAYHFKNWYLKENPANSSDTKTSISFSKNKG